MQWATCVGGPATPKALAYNYGSEACIRVLAGRLLYNFYILESRVLTCAGLAGELAPKFRRGLEHCLALSESLTPTQVYWCFDYLWFLSAFDIPIQLQDQAFAQKRAWNAWRRPNQTKCLSLYGPWICGPCFSKPGHCDLWNGSALSWCHCFAREQHFERRHGRPGRSRGHSWAKYQCLMWLLCTYEKIQAKWPNAKLLRSPFQRPWGLQHGIKQTCPSNPSTLPITELTTLDWCLLKKCGSIWQRFKRYGSCLNSSKTSSSQSQQFSAVWNSLVLSAYSLVKIALWPFAREK